MASFNSLAHDTPKTNAPSRLTEFPDPLERHYSPQDLALLWGLDVSTVRRMFQDEPGVLKIGRSNRRDGKRDYTTLRIPESVVRRVYAKKIQRRVR